MKKYDTVIIGGGPGGYVAAIRLAQLKKKVALIEKNQLGGVCLNIGCIPSKALIHASEVYQTLFHAREIGIETKDVQVNFKQTQHWKEGVVSKLTGGIQALLKANGVEWIKGEALFLSQKEMAIKKGKEKETIGFDAAIIAVGSSSASLPGFENDGEWVVTSTEALSFTKIPKTLCVIGGGYIGLEIGSLYARLGAEVTVVEATGSLLPGVDPELVRFVERELKRRNVTIHLNTKALQWKKTQKQAELTLEGSKGKSSLTVDKVLVAVGRIPNTKNLGLEGIGIQVDSKGFIQVDEKRQTNVDSIFAIGDCAGGPLLAHKASKEGLVAAAAIVGHKEIYDVRAMPAVIFTSPEIATVGLTEGEAKAQGYETKVGKFPFQASGRALAMGNTDGFVKMVVDAKTDQILGVFIVGPHASSLIGEATLAIEMGALAEDVARTVHPHPTFTETLMEAADAVHGAAIHIFQR